MNAYSFCSKTWRLLCNVAIHSFETCFSYCVYQFCLFYERRIKFILFLLNTKLTHLNLSIMMSAFWFSFHSKRSMTTWALYPLSKQINIAACTSSRTIKVTSFIRTVSFTYASTGHTERITLKPCLTMVNILLF